MIMPQQFYNNLKFYCLKVRDNVSDATSLLEEFETKFMALDKYSQLEISLAVSDKGFKKAFEILDIV